MNTNQRFAISIHALTLLAANVHPLTSEMIASSVDTNPVVIRRTMASLRERGLVDSKPGMSGGWRLKREPGKIHLLEVYRSLQEADVLSIHSHPNQHCPIGGNITAVLRTVFDEAQAQMESVLADRTVADILNDVRRNAK